MGERGGPSTVGAARRAPWRSVAIPTEHGGWSLTAEPVLLGLAVAPSWPGLALGAAAVTAFVARTPLKIVLVDRRRRRRLDRTRLARRILVAELVVLLALAALAWAGARRGFWIPLAAASPLIAVELWYDMRSRSRRLIPELAGAIGIGAFAAAIALAGATPTSTAIGLWGVLAARSVAAVPYVRCQISRTRSHPWPRWHSDLAQLVALVVAAAGWSVGLVPAAGVGAIGVLVVADLVLLRRPPRRAVAIGVEQTLIGLLVIATTAIAVVD